MDEFAPSLKLIEHAWNLSFSTSAQVKFAHIDPLKTTDVNIKNIFYHAMFVMFFSPTTPEERHLQTD